MEPAVNGTMQMQSPVPYTKSQPLEKSQMTTETKNFFENPNAGQGAGWGAAGGALVGALVGSNGLGGLGGNREPAVTPDQLQATINGLQSQMSTDALQGQIGRLQGQVAETGADATIALGAAIGGVKDAVNHNASHMQLALCGLGHNVQAGFASVNQTILLEGAKGRELTLSENLAQARAALAAAHNDAGHKSTQVMIQQLVASGNP